MFLPKPNEGGSFELAPAGSFIATCFRFIDRGTQQTSYEGQQKTRHEVMLSWEIADEQMTDGRPFTVSKIYTWSMHEKAALRADLESWRGRAFVDADFDGPDRFHLRKLLGVPCVLTIIHGKKGDGSASSKISAIGKMFKGQKGPPLVNPITYFALIKDDGFDETVLDALPNKTKEAIKNSPEYRNIVNPQQDAVHDDGPDPDSYGAGPNDDCPF